MICRRGLLSLNISPRVLMKPPPLSFQASQIQVSCSSPTCKFQVLQFPLGAVMGAHIPVSPEFAQSPEVEVF